MKGLRIEFAREGGDLTLVDGNGPAREAPNDLQVFQVEHFYARPVASTTRKRALPLIIRSKASFALASGITSFIERTPVRALKASVSSASMDTPEYQPATLRLPAIIGNAGTASGVGGAPRMRSFPSTPSPPIMALIAPASVTVASTTRAPPSSASALAGSSAVLSM